MSIRNYSREHILEGINRYEPVKDNRIRLLFAQNPITEKSFDQVCRLYANLKDEQYDDVIVIESFGREHEKYLPMISAPSIETSLGSVQINDLLRNDFCDEDDDFYIDDHGFSEKMAVYDQLMMLQSVLDDFKLLSIQVASLRPSIVRELAMAVSELMRDRNALIVVCGDASNAADGALAKIRDMIAANDVSRLMNFLNTGDAGVEGAGPLAAGILIAHDWELSTSIFTPSADEDSVLSGFSRLRQIPQPV